ncbi:MAG: hypothetical protein V2A74_12380 [bacterium]
MARPRHSRRNGLVLLLLPIMIVAALWLASPCSAQPVAASKMAPESIDVFMKHGILPTTEGLLKFVSEGFPSDADYSQFPNAPQEKTQLLLWAMEVLGKRRDKKAVPILISYVQRDFPRGVQRILELDQLQTPADQRLGRREALADFLRYNAANALGLIADPAAMPALEQIYLNAETPVTKCQHALNLASVGSDMGMSYLVGQISLANRDTSVVAARNFFLITGQDYGLTVNSSVSMRRTLSEHYVQWWEENKAMFHLDPEAIVQRRFAVSRLTRIPLDSLETLLRASSARLDVANELGSRDAQARLVNAGESILPELEKTLRDEDADLNVRIEAMRWYVHHKSKSAKSLLKKLHKDENPEVSQEAQNLLDLIDKGGENATQLFPPNP